MNSNSADKWKSFARCMLTQRKNTCGHTPMQTHADIETKNIFDYHESEEEQGVLAAVWGLRTHVCPFSRKYLWAVKP